MSALHFFSRSQDIPLQLLSQSDGVYEADITCKSIVALHVKSLALTGEKILPIINITATHNHEDTLSRQKKGDFKAPAPQFPTDALAPIGTLGCKHRFIPANKANRLANNHGPRAKKPLEQPEEKSSRRCTQWVRLYCVDII
jgi:hypothetical protein